MIRLFLVSVVVGLLTGCTANRYCLADQPYSHEQSIPPIQSADGLKLPESSAALRIPPPPADPQPFGKKVRNEKGDEVVECLDQPPRMPKPVEEKPAEAPRPADAKPAA
jgi:hypothetical protein